MRTPASEGDRAASRHVVEQLWAAWVDACAPDRATVARLARDSGVEAETLRVLIRCAGQGALRSGPGFLTVARLARSVSVDLNGLARGALSIGKRQ
jgi:hypothetical protein